MLFKTRDENDPILMAVRRIPDAAFLHRMNEPDISAAERRLGLRFAPEYRTYVARYGVVSGRGIELTGITLGPHLDVVRATLRERELGTVLEPDRYVVETYGNGIIALQDESGAIHLSFGGKCDAPSFSSLKKYIEYRIQQERDDTK